MTAAGLHRPGGSARRYDSHVAAVNGPPTAAVLAAVVDDLERSFERPPNGAIAAGEGDAEEFSAAVAAVTAAFGDATRREIYLHVRDHGGATAAEVARRFGLHPNVARHHLDKLAAGGYVEVSLDHSGASAGRPSKRYRRARHVEPLTVPPRSDALVVGLLAKALGVLPPATAEALAIEVGEEYGRNLAAQMSPGDSQRSMRSAMLAVADALTAHGFAARAEERDAKTAIVRDCCPFGDLVTSYPVLCALDRGMVQGLLSGLCGDAVPVQLLSSSRALGDAACSSVAGRQVAAP